MAWKKSADHNIQASLSNSLLDSSVMRPFSRICFAALLFCSTQTIFGQTQETAARGPISLDDAIRMAEANEPTFAAALAEGRAKALERKDARTALLPSATYHNQYLFTQSHGPQATTTE